MALATDLSRLRKRSLVAAWIIEREFLAVGAEVEVSPRLTGLPEPFSPCIAARNVCRHRKSPSWLVLPIMHLKLGVNLRVAAAAAQSRTRSNKNEFHRN